VGGDCLGVVFEGEVPGVEEVDLGVLVSLCWLTGV
jgi:hypothetical protein